MQAELEPRAARTVCGGSPGSGFESWLSFSLTESTSPVLQSPTKDGQHGLLHAVTVPGVLRTVLRMGERCFTSQRTGCIPGLKPTALEGGDV